MRSYSYVYYIVFFGRKKTHREYKPKRLTEDICFILIISYEKNGRLFRAVGAGEPGEGGHGPRVMAHQILTNQLALSQQGGGTGDRFMRLPHYYLLPSWIFRPPYGPAPVCAKREM